MHSIAAGLAATRGGFTTTLGAASIPAASNSETPAGSVPELAFIASNSGRVERLKTNSPEAMAYSVVCFIPSEEKHSTAGREPSALKKL